jgi:hypothetical protein
MSWEVEVTIAEDGGEPVEVASEVTLTLNPKPKPKPKAKAKAKTKAKAKVKSKSKAKAKANPNLLLLGCSASPEMGHSVVYCSVYVLFICYY